MENNATELMNQAAVGPPRNGGVQHHLTCLQLGKRQHQYCSDKASSVGSAAARANKRSGAVDNGPTCQVQGCPKTLIDAKDYYKRHRVCDLHSKASTALVLGLQQRFCQQCSRFHGISEFDGLKRSCRRRLAGHNERRRKINSTDSIVRNSTLLFDSTHLSESSSSRALSLLSSPWIIHPELSSQSTAAFHELIAQNRDSINLTRQLFSNHGCFNTSYINNQSNVISFVPNSSQDDNLTLDLMKCDKSTPFIKDKSKEDECCGIWKSFEGTHVL